MKTFFAVWGVLSIVAVSRISGGSYFAYKKGTSKMVEMGQMEVDKFVQTKHPTESVANSLHRLLNAVKLHQSWSSTMMVSVALSALQDGIVSLDEEKMIGEAAQLTEQGEVTKVQMADFMKKYQAVMPRGNYPPPTR